MKILLSFLVLSFCSLSFAEYRVYQYIIKNKLPIEDEPKSYYVKSTLDPISYQSYHGGDSSISINLVRTWTCHGNTSKKPLCKSPLKKLMEATNE